LQDIQNFQEPEISRQLEDFRSKRLMGMTPGEQELSELEWSRARDPSGCESKEKQLAEQLLARLEEMQAPVPSELLQAPLPSSIIFGAVVTYMKFLGVRTKGGDAKKSKSNFFRKKISGKEPQGKARKGFSLPGAALWGRDAHSEWGATRVGVGDPSLPSAGPHYVPFCPPSLSGVPPHILFCRCRVQAEQRPRGIPGRLGRSESLRVPERRRSQKLGGGRQPPPRSRSNADLQGPPPT
ncbi:ARHG1 factor, partial [Donacobius atricapilla]|nr:ARHG1 factor [Donacobius atricapilla]